MVDVYESSPETGDFESVQRESGLEEYCLIKQIGRGGMGVVYRAWHMLLEREVAIKVISADRAEDTTVRKSFRKEAMVMSGLNHPHIARVYGAGENEEDQLYLIMELVHGITLSEAIRKRLLSTDEKNRVILQVCSALEYLHENGVVHGDIKPSNIMIDSEGNAKVIDFGLCGLLVNQSKGGEDRNLNSGQENREELIFRSPKYGAPEQFSEETPIDQRADLYSLGVMIHEILTGYLPGSMFVSMEKRLVRLTEKQRPVFSRMLEYDPMERYASIQDVRPGLGGLFTD